MDLPAGITHRIVLIRHGEPSETARGRCYGKLNVGLSNAGRKQIERIADFAARFKFAAVYSSPRERATESARIVAAPHDLATEEHADFAEIDFGDFEGLEFAEVERRFPDVYRQWMTAPTSVEFPNGESFAQMKRRVLSGIAELKRRRTGETFAVVSHGGVNRIVLADALQIADENIFRLAQDYAATNVIDFYDDFPVVKMLNLTPENLRL